MPSPLGPAIHVFGYLLFGNFFNAIIYGIITVQAGLYYSKFKKDPVQYRILVGFLWLIEGFQLAVSASAVYDFLITAQVNTFILIFETWRFSYHATHSVIATTIVQGFYCNRLYQLSRSKIAAAVVACLIAAQCGAGIYANYRTYIFKTTQEVAEHETWDVNLWQGLAAGADVAIAVAMTIVLRRQKTGFSNTDSALNFIIVYGIQTGLLTTIFALLQLFTYAIKRYFESLLILGFPQGSVYIFTMLASLHARSGVRTRMEGNHGYASRSTNGKKSTAKGYDGVIPVSSTNGTMTTGTGMRSVGNTSVTDTGPH